MVNPLKGEVELKAGDQSYILRLGSNALAEVEVVLDTGVGEIVASLQGQNIKLGTLRAILWGALREHQETMSLFDAGDIIDKIGVAATMAAIGRAFKLAFPKAEGGAKNPRTAGTGKGSSTAGSRSASRKKPSGR
jgi:hypothetical protein